MTLLTDAKELLEAIKLNYSSCKEAGIDNTGSYIKQLHISEEMENLKKSIRQEEFNMECFTYKGKKYPTMMICLKHPEIYPKGAWQRISTNSFSDALTGGTGEYTEPRAIELDEKIYGYIPDDAFERADLKDIAEKHLDEKFESIENNEEDPPDYKKAYGILIKYFDSISDEEQPKVEAELKKVGL